ncbi:MULTISPECIES: formimidoylglutamase [Elizabethkingia]|uniref:formimidoylglutamase n=1 Tax=Elizabethkingia TaxID=308865 RepID=UPI0021A8F338|nr:MULTISPECIES: formimidoylglutamase [Elizabethkingia]MCT3687756.1 formimidoylglutamase [Elizabethkingia anophelis]MCT3706685.1 formimidoylglutamase [Elizabethkingia anophelis]MCT3714116.1 formimidoylglutamase [Elizabethkingia anophelis]MCT3717535.1 formimidoylglutamase [Elizabethkingia anophelis]MCT3731792.1 formimidoylglutamase [Elizabethkingia anophelis]
MERIWSGRFDGEDLLSRRLFQAVEEKNDYEEIADKSFFLHGFAVDEGVKRNKGRVGAAAAPNVIRKNMSNFPVVSPSFRLFDFGDIYCPDENLEKTQQSLANAVASGLLNNGKSIVLGGGHEVTYAHYSGIKKAFPGKKIGIINFDAHFDNREPENNLASSGTGFWQIANEGEIHSLHIGIQRNSNTLKLFDTAHQYGMKYILADEIFFENLPQLYPRIDEFLDGMDVLYVTICMDVFNASIAPGVSASAYNGIFTDQSFMLLYRHILRNNKLKALDVAEVNPVYDIQDRTARLAASLVNEWLMI